MWGVLKADAYGHGAPAVARTLERAGIGGLCVALLEEAIELREAGIRAPILVMGGYYGPRRQGLEEILAHDIVPVIYDRGHVEKLVNVARTSGRGRSGCTSRSTRAWDGSGPTPRASATSSTRFATIAPRSTCRAS